MMTVKDSDVLLGGASVCMIKGCKCRTPRFTSFLFQRGWPRRVSNGIIYNAEGPSSRDL